jgi:hypothetical protein
MIETAKHYKNFGLSVLPTRKDKSPATKKTSGVTIPLSDFKYAFGIGIKCGKESGNLECFDFDNKFSDAKQILSEFLKIEEVRDVYQKHKLPIESTVSGGYHLLYRCSKNEGSLKLARRPKWDETRNKWIPVVLIETRGEGGYFCADPTPGYKVIRNNILEINEISVEEREILFTAARSFNQFTEIKTNNFEQKERPGDYYNNQPEAIDEMKNSLLKNGWKNLKTYLWRRPNKKTGVSATLGKVAPNVFYNFSANGYPFEPMAGYTPFQVVCLLDHQGDFKKFAQELAARYNLSTPDTYIQNRVEKKTDKKLDKKTLGDIRVKTFVDVQVPVDKPPVIMSINHSDRIAPNWKRLMTLGNFSCFTGKSKSKKTFLLTTIMSTLGMNYIDESVKFKADMPENKRMVLHFDTEQADYDAYVTAKRIHDIAGTYMPHVGTFNLREYKPAERLLIIQNTIEFFKQSVGVVVIDGVADLVKSVNNEDESNEILHSFMKWTKEYNCHIANILHQNKKDNFATGWLGTQIMKKAELVMAIEREPDENLREYSNVICDVIRGVEEFPPFSFKIDERGLPEIYDLINPK